MATTIYFTTSTSVDITPSVHSNWSGGQASADFVRRYMDTSDSGTSSNQEATMSTLNEECQIQYISKPLAAQTISGSIDITTSQRVSATGATYFVYHARVVTSGGTTRGVLVDNTGSTSTSIPSSSYSTVSESSVALSSVAVTAGDYLVVEIGYGVYNSSSKTFGTQAGVGSISFTDTITFITAPTSLAYPYSTYTPITGYNSTSGTPTYSGGEGGVIFSVLSGSIPAGQTLNTSTGTITGSPTTAATYTPTIRVSNALGNSDQALTFNTKDYDGKVTELATCNTNLTTCNTNLSTCNTNLSTCNTNLSTCETNLTTCETDLAAEVKKKSWTLKPEL